MEACTQQVEMISDDSADSLQQRAVVFRSLRLELQEKNNRYFDSCRIQRRSSHMKVYNRNETNLLLYSLQQWRASVTKNQYRSKLIQLAMKFFKRQLFLKLRRC